MKVMKWVCRYFFLGLILALAGLSLAGLAALLYKSVHCKAVAQKDDDETE